MSRVTPRVTVGIVDYGVGNLASVRQALHGLGFRCRVSHDPQVLAETDLLLLPGVGAFPPAMAALRAHGLADVVTAEAAAGKGVIGICLGMQLLAESSVETRPTSGLGLIPGAVREIEGGRWHIGWNTMRVVQPDALFAQGDGREVYFNHAFVFEADPAATVACASLEPIERPLTVAVRRDNVVGLQFHPEKSQAAGHRLLADVIRGLARA